MDIAMVAGGLLVSICQALSPQQIESIIRVLDQLAERPTMSPAEQHIFRVLSDTLAGKDSRPVVQFPKQIARFEVIQGGVS